MEIGQDNHHGRLEGLAGLFQRLKQAQTNNQIKQVEEELYGMEVVPGFAGRLAQFVSDGTHQRTYCVELADLRLSAATYLRRMIARCRQAETSAKLDMCAVILSILKSSTPIKIKKVSLAGSTLLMSTPGDSQKEVQQYLCRTLQEGVLSCCSDSDALSYNTLEYVTLLGELVLLCEHVPVEFVAQFFDRFVVLLAKIVGYCSAMLDKPQKLEQQWTQNLTLLKEMTVLLRIIFKRKDFIGSDFFRQLLLSRDVVVLLEQVYLLSTRESSIPHSMLEVSQSERCTLLNQAKSNCVNVQCRMLEQLIALDRKVHHTPRQDGVITQSYLYERSDPHLDLFLASMLNCKWLDNQHSKEYRSIRKAIDEMLRLAATAVNIVSCYQHFSRNRERWLTGFLIKLFEVSAAEYTQFEEDPENYLCYLDQLMKDKPSPQQLELEGQEDLIVHIAGRSLMLALLKYLDGTCSFVCKWSFDTIVNSSLSDPARLTALKVIGVSFEALADRPDFIRQLMVYFERRVFTPPKHVVSSTCCSNSEIEACLHVLVLAKSVRHLRKVSPTIDGVALQLVMDILNGKSEMCKGNQPVRIAALWLITQVFRESTEHCVEVLQFLLSSISDPDITAEQLEAIMVVVTDSSTIHANPDLVRCCVGKLIWVMDWQLQKSANTVLAGKAWDIVVELCCSKLLQPASVAYLQLQLRPILKYIEQPVRVDFGDEFVQIMLNLINKSSHLGQFAIGATSLYVRIFQWNSYELEEMLHLANAYLLKGDEGFYSQHPAPLVIFAQLAMQGLGAKVALHGRVEAAILLQSLSLHAGLLWKLGQMPTILARLHSIFSEEADNISGSFAQKYFMLQFSLVAALTIMVSVSLEHLPEQQRTQIVSFCLKNERCFKDLYSLKCYCCGLINLVGAHTRHLLTSPTLDQLVELTIAKLHFAYCSTHDISQQVMQPERTERFSSMMERLHNAITEAEEFSQFTNLMHGLMRSQPQLYTELVSSLSLSGKERLKLLFGIRSFEVGVRRVVKIKRS